MNEENIRKYALLMQELDLTGLEITEDNRMVRLERESSHTETTGCVRRTVREIQADPLPEAAQSPAALPKKDITSPMVGVFYAAPAENAEPFVRVGEEVHEGDTLCIIEAMKLMNEITAERDGVITDICVKNGQVVEYGSVLFRLGEKAS